MATAAPPPQTDAPPEAKPYYGYLIKDDKSPTPLFAAFLRALAQHIIDNIDDTNITLLSPPKLAAFYKLAGADYDALFLETSNPSISYTWQVTGCQHSLQPTANDFAPPSIPALTVKGFVRWQSLQTLLCPEIHVPVLQYAANNWGLKNLETGETFPPDLPKEALPAVPDPVIEKWHDECAQTLQREAANAAREKPASPRSTSVPRTKSRPIFKESEYFHPRDPREDRFSDYPPTPTEPRVRVHSPHFHTESHNLPPRRHSHPHHHVSSSESSDADDDLPTIPPRGARHIPRPDDPPMPSVRRVYPQGPTVIPDPYPPGPIPPGKRESSSSGGDRRRREERIPFPNLSRSPRRSPHRSEEPPRRSRGVSGPLRDRLSSFLPTGVTGVLNGMTKPDRPRSSSRTHSHSSEQGNIPQRYSKESLQSSKLGRGWSYDSDDGDNGSNNGDRHRHRDRDFERERERDRVRRDHGDPREYPIRRERERERDRMDRADHAEPPFRNREKDFDHERERERDRERERGRGQDYERREHERERGPDAHIPDRGRRESLREKKKNKSLDRSRDRSHEQCHEPDRPDDDRDYRSRRERDRDRERGRDRYPLRTETLKRPIVSADVER
ncbi:hydroxyproline-rich glycoprotein dz-hrgp [Ophiostoma piceae UAMH 11346]|uniref:Hydroxyproline-rich glycoprotein dz-hrgp n=1 Tax=Ophiostoma piceae (strain UAMH 11346) TaxID=1262450 RepID=S3CEC7_OPHP1|nr:hydroxyproline-rich glycoprotein dz-hrgp [Ophiostoma piceae UAMH 11346]